MFNLSKIKSLYPSSLQGFDRFILREYFQYQILQIIFDSKFAVKFCFLGGTCLRIVHDNKRFSEDLDFDNFNVSENEFVALSRIIKEGLENNGYVVELRTVHRGAYHCYINFPEILYREGLSGHKEEKILIQLDTEPQHFDFKPQTQILNKFDILTKIFVTPKDILLAQKFYAILNRKRNKGRDFFDIVFLLSETKPNYQYLDQKLGIDNPKELKKRILEKCSELDMLKMAEDVRPFLFNSKDINKISLFSEYLTQVEL